MVRLDNRSNKVCWFNSSCVATLFLAKSCNRTYPPAETFDCFMDYFSMWYNQENSHVFFPIEAIKHLIQEMTVKDAEEVLRYQNEATLFFTAVGGTQYKGDDLCELPPVYGVLEPGLEFFKFMKPSMVETTMPYRCRHCNEKGNAKKKSPALLLSFPSIDNWWIWSVLLVQNNVLSLSLWPGKYHAAFNSTNMNLPPHL